MSRRPIFVSLAAATLAVGLPAANADIELPRLTCAKRWVDSATNDAYLNPTGQASANVAALQTPGLDLESAFLRSTPETVELYAKVQAIPAPNEMSQRDLAYRYVFQVKIGTKSFDIAHWQKNSQYTGVVTGAAHPSTTPFVQDTTATVDHAKDFVHIVVQRPRLDAVVGAPVADGDTIELTSVKSEWLAASDNPNARVKVDEIVPAATARAWTVGNNFCFGLPPASLSDVTVAGVQFTDVTTMSAKLVDENGVALADQELRFTVTGAPGGPLVGTTNAEGIATVQYTATLPAGTYPVKVDYLGTAAIGAAAPASGSLVVAQEVTKFKALSVKRTSSTGRTVTATLLDNDGKPVAGEKVGWYVNGKLVSTLVTDAAGRSAYKAKATQKVQAKYAGVTGKYGPAASNIAKV